MLESEISAKILRYLKATPRCFAWKEHGGAYGRAGLPDILACVDGHFYAFEVKRPGGQLTVLQAATLKEIGKAGGTARKVESLDDVKAILDGLDGEDDFS